MIFNFNYSYMINILNRRFVLCLLLLSNFSIMVKAQSEFRTFLESFTEYKWEELIGPSKYLEIKDTINFEYANRNMWHEHSNIERETKSLSYATPAPHIRINGGEYAKYHHGFHGFYNKGIKTSDGFIKSNLYTVARVSLSKNFVLLILKYEYYDPEEGYSSSIEAFTFRLNDEQMLSAINLTNTAQTFIEKDRTITSFEYYDVPTDDPENDEGYIRYRCKKVYKIDDDGYFNQIRFEESERDGYLYLGKINDTDGWSYVRETPDNNSAVLYKVLNDKFVYVEKLKNSSWCRILMYKESNDNRKEGGYIHSSRVNRLNPN